MAVAAGTAAPVAATRRVSRRVVVAAIVIAWLVLFAALRGRQTLALAAADLTDLHRWFNSVNDSIGADRNSNPSSSTSSTRSGWSSTNSSPSSSH